MMRRLVFYALRLVHRCLFDDHHFNGLLFFLVEHSPLVFHLFKVNGFQVEAPDVAVVHGAVVDAAVGNVRHHCSLCGTGNVGNLLPLLKLYARGDVEVVEEVKRLRDSFFCRSLLGRSGLEKGCTHKA